jgi:hypothetical protein
MSVPYANSWQLRAETGRGRLCNEREFLTGALANTLIYRLFRTWSFV